MAGEKKGKLYEALVATALRRVADANKKSKWILFWNVTPEGMTIEPDFTLGANKDSPDCVFLVTHSGSAKESEKKHWRNMGELLEAKTLLAKEALVFSVIFEGVMKQSLVAIQQRVFDGQLATNDKPYGSILSEWVARNSNQAPVNQDEKIGFIESSISGSIATPSKYKKAIQRFIGDIEKLVQADLNSDLSTLWSAERKRTRLQPQVEQNTLFRRGIAKLLLFGPPYNKQFDRLGRLRAHITASQIESLKLIGVIKESIGGPRLADPDIHWVLSNVDGVLIEKVCNEQPSERMQVWIEPLLSLSDIAQRLSYVQQHWEKLISANSLFEILSNTNATRSGINAAGSSSGNWLFHTIIEWIKCSTNSRTGFGNAQLLQDLERLVNNDEHRATVHSIAGQSAIWRAGDTIRLGLQDWYNPSSTQNFPIGKDDLARVSDALARRLLEISPPEAERDSEIVVRGIIQSNLNTKLLTYWLMQPLESLLCALADEENLPNERLQHFYSCYGQYTIQSGVRVDRRAGGTTVRLINNHLVAWQSATDAGRDHKKKELCGRAPALRYEWVSSMHSFAPRTGIRQLFLLLDGSWRQSDLDALARSGWKCYFPNQVDELKKSLKK